VTESAVTTVDHTAKPVVTHVDTQPLTTVEQVPPNPVPITWLITQARLNAPRLAASKAREDRVAALARQAGRWDDPEVEAEAGHLTDDVSQRRGRLAINQSVPLFGSKDRAREAAAAMGPVAVAERREAELALVSDVRLAAATLEAAARRERLATAGVELSRQVLSLVESQLGANLAQELDRVRAQVDLAEAEAAIERAQQEYAAALASLSRLVGASLPNGISLDAGTQPADLDLPAALAAAENHPTLKRAAALAGVAEAQYGAARAAGRPDIVVGVFGERDDDVTEVGVAAGMRIPIWNGNRNGVDAAGADVRIARAEIIEQRRLVLAEAENAWHIHEQAVRHERTVRSRLLPGAESALRLAQAAYGAGGGDLAAVLDARRTLARLSLEAENAAAAVATARIQLDRAIATEMIP
jgi:cobalt-zinc-cadmium efflux system outer membrane protein